MINNDGYKSGTWRNPKEDDFNLLPKRVQESVHAMMNNGEVDADWQCFTTGNTTWFVAKIWDENTFEITASVVKFTSTPSEGKDVQIVL